MSVMSREHRRRARDPQDLDSLRDAVVHELISRHLTVSCAESLTGGAVCARIVDVPGSSETFRGGVVTYATDTKASVLGVDTAQLAATGPVDRRVACQMARGVARLMGADIGVATTGVAGPGPADGYAAGTVWIAIAGALGEESRLLDLSGTRADIRDQTVDEVIHLLDDALAAGRPAGLA